MVEKMKYLEARGWKRQARERQAQIIGKEGKERKERKEREARGKRVAGRRVNPIAQEITL